MGGQSLLVEGPSQLKLQVIGGPLGTGPCRRGSSAMLSGQESGRTEIPLGTDATEFGQMGSAESVQRKAQVERQKLLERYAFVDSLTEILDI